MPAAGKPILNSLLLVGQSDTDLFVVTLAVLRGDAGTRGTADKDALFKHFGSTGADFGKGADDLVGLKLHLAGSVADVSDFAVSLNIVAGINGSLEFDHIVSTEKAFIAILFDKEFGSHIAKEMNHVGAINEIAAIVGVFCAHANAEHRGNCHIFQGL